MPFPEPAALLHQFPRGIIAATNILQGGLALKKKFLALLLALTLCVPTAAALEGDSLRAAEKLASYGVVQGTPAGYDVESFCTRAQALVMLSRLSGYTDGGTDPFSDTPSWAKTAVAALHEAGLLKGVYSGKRLYSSEHINADEWSALLLHLCGIEASAQGAAQQALRTGLLSKRYSGTLTRGEIFRMTCDALSYSRNGVTLAQQLGKEPSGAQRLSAREVADHSRAAVCALTLYPTVVDDAKNTRRVDASAFFLTEDGIALTNYHPLKNMTVGYATLITGEVFLVEGILWKDAAADLALIRVSRTAKDGTATVPAFAAVTLADSGEVSIGDRVYAIGNALGMGISVSEGIVGLTDCRSSISSIPSIVNTADISAGSSGGALFNEAGHVVAVNSVITHKVQQVRVSQISEKTGLHGIHYLVAVPGQVFLLVCGPAVIGFPHFVAAPVLPQ
jgi:S1-C subfamily serine protease